MNITKADRWRLPALVATAAFVFAVVGHTLVSDTDLGGRSATALALCQALAIVLQFRLPLLGWAIGLGAVVSAALLVGETPWVDAMFNSYLLVVGILALLVPWRWTLGVLAATATAGIALVTAVPGGGLVDVVATTLLTGIVLLAGAALRALFEARRDAISQTRESERQRRRNALLEERTRIARELHDVVAHHMSVVAIQAESARYRVADPPQDLIDSLTAIRTSAAAALDEMRRILGVLRADRESPTQPQPQLEEVDELIDRIRRAGREVTLIRHGTPAALPSGITVSAYRIVQEALSNALQHAPGSAISVELHYRADELDIEVHNGPSSTPATSSGGGHGLVGMRERVALWGGRFTAEPESDGGYRVRAALPLEGRTPP
ncbi:sensor histidine kinase [Nocardia mangyaensis]|uniref:sensor histidine kinase n=1 Tax=Nocardia mangyaensis TaxID=2213200 RepID=UPI002675A728|nr:histidine kinase [Nocardia mangyaensis]MDO3646200.1 histidine kinase [Nocardia mangyaensis]